MSLSSVAEKIVANDSTLSGNTKYDKYYLMRMSFSVLSASEIEAKNRAERTRAKKPLARRISFAFVFMALLVSVVLPVWFWTMRAVSILHHVDTKPALLRIYDHFFDFQYTIRDTFIPGTLGQIEMRVYTPTGARNPAPIVLIHGFAHEGNKNLYLNALAKHLATVGFFVAIPTVPSASHSEMRASDLQVIGDVVRWTAHTTGQKVTLFGISFGGGLVIPAGAQPSASPFVKLIFCFSGYNNLDSIGRYYIHQHVLDPSGHPYQGHAPGPLAITSPYLSELVPPQDAAALSPAVRQFDDNEGRPLPPNDPAMRGLNAKQRQEWDELQEASTPQIRQLYLRVLTSHRAEIAAISPSSVLANLTIPIYILHGSGDIVFPEGEVEWMRQELAHNRDAHILVSPWIDHVFVGQPATTWQKLKVLGFCAQIFGRAAHRTPLAK
ncbi:MAG TPA: alpha/beta hydrolase [Acidobacteriaceae bacterium]|nr:alpha/beta hydrolase [Acidobacteriaceae bacterium]